MNPRQYMILAKGEFITPNVISSHYNPQKNHYDITFKTGKKYSYSYDNVICMKKPVVLNPVNYKIKHKNKELYRISEIYEFTNGKKKYWHICYKNGHEQDYYKSALAISFSCLRDGKSKKVFDYMKDSANLVSIHAEDGTKLLLKQYEKIEFISDNKVISNYFNPNRYLIKKYPDGIPIFPFGCNASQYSAVNKALSNQLSVIQGPPGTGKTQTILNIIANLLIAGKTVQVVSNNNSATANVLEKLSSSEYSLGFIVAMLGNSDNKDRFVREQNNQYPNIIQSWDSSLLKDSYFLKVLHKQYMELNKTFKNQERLALKTQMLQDLEVELKHFEQYLKETNRLTKNIKKRKDLRSDIYLQLWKNCQISSDRNKKLSFIFKLKCRYLYGIADWNFYVNEIDNIVTLFQRQFYKAKRSELQLEIKDLEKELSVSNHNKLSQSLSKMSLQYLKAVLKKKYNTTVNRNIFKEEDFWKNPKEIQKEYPVILSTTFSARSSLNKSAEFDYIIIDEASQVDVVTGALALSCATNAVIVGDNKQLPNVVTRKKKNQLQAVFESYNINKSYNFAEKSFLQSVSDVIPNIPQTLLREHYRCHPKIINFCNQKFYGGNLLIMTEDKGEEGTISVIKTVIGNHERDHMNQRQIDVVNQEVLPRITCSADDIGIIAPYKNQIKALKGAISDNCIDIATVHKFQGREKDTIIITTVDNKVTNFSDDPNLLNVAISRAKEHLYIVVSGNEQPKDSNIRDLIEYIDYNNVVIESNIYSVFDFLYNNYTKSRLRYLKGQKRISKYDSENLMYAMIKDILHENNYFILSVVCHQPLHMLIRDTSQLNDAERLFAMNRNTHLDFLIYNRLSKKPILAIEVDGYRYHKKGSIQSERDIKKDHILQLYGIPLLRFATNGSGEKEKLIEKLNEINV